MKILNLKKLKKKLPSDYAKTISDEFNVSVQYVYQIINGVNQNENILKRLIELAKSNKENQKVLSEEIANL